jgi:excisionase family DNA binding protein
MEELLTTKQVQDLLQVDRTTIYRMLNDGRLTGIKIHSHWRFRRQEIDNLLSSASHSDKAVSAPSHILPLHCIQSIQNVFAQIADVGSIVTDMNGQPVSKISHCSKFCSLIQKSPSGYQACVDSWKRLAQSGGGSTPEFMPCHAGLQYARGYINVDHVPTAMIVAGQFFVQPPDPSELDMRVRRLAILHGIGYQELSSAVQEIAVLDDKKQAQIGNWMLEVAKTFGEIGSERAEMLRRLKAISEISTMEFTD